MASGARIAPLRMTGAVVSVPHTTRVRPLPLTGLAGTVAGTPTNNPNYFLMVPHLWNQAISATVGSSTASATYPASALITLPISTGWRSTGVTSENITFDLGAPNAIDIVSIVNHNLTSAATITIAAGSTNAYADFSTSMTWRQYTAFKWLNPAQSYRFWKITFADSGNTDGFLEVGYVVIAAAGVHGFMFNNGWTNTPQFVNSNVQTEFGIPITEQLFHRQHVEMDFGPLNANQMSAFLSIYQACKRNAYPALLVPVRGGSDAYFGRIQNMFEAKVDFYRYVSIQFTEDSFGQRIG